MDDLSMVSSSSGINIASQIKGRKIKSINTIAKPNEETENRQNGSKVHTAWSDVFNNPPSVGPEKVYITKTKLDEEHYANFLSEFCVYRRYWPGRPVPAAPAWLINTPARHLAAPGHQVSAFPTNRNTTLFLKEYHAYLNVKSEKKSQLSPWV